MHMCNHTIRVTKSEKFELCLKHEYVFLFFLKGSENVCNSDYGFRTRFSKIHVKRANHTIEVAKMTEFLHTSTFVTDTTILEHSGVGLGILRAPQLYLNFAPRPPQAIYVSASCPMLGLGNVQITP